METLSMIVGYIGTAAAIIGFQCKKQTSLLASQIAANFFVALSFLFLGVSKMAGGATCMIAVVQTAVNFFYQKHEKKPPIWTLLLFGAFYAGATALTTYLAGSFQWFMIFPFLCAVLFMFAISSVNPTFSRMMFLSNTTLWIIYDFVGEFAIANLTTHILVLLSVVVGIVRYDILKKQGK